VAHILINLCKSKSMCSSKWFWRLKNYFGIFEVLY